MREEMNIQDVAAHIRSVTSLKPDLIKKIGIFGSLARGDFNEESDIDLLVEYNSPPFFLWIKLHNTANCAIKWKKPL
jgi:predicted nucleotidyltransferase